MKLFFLRKRFCFFISFLLIIFMQKNYAIIAGILLTAMLGIIAQPAFAEYNDLDKGLYEQMEKSKAKVDIAT